MTRDKLTLGGRAGDGKQYHAFVSFPGNLNFVSKGYKIFYVPSCTIAILPQFALTTKLLLDFMVIGA